MIEEKVQIILPIILRNVGPLLLRGGLGGLSGGGASTNTDTDDDFDDDDSTANDGNSSTSVRQGDNGRKVSISLPTFPPDTDDDDEDEDADENNTIKTTSDKTNVSNIELNEKEMTKIQSSEPSTVIFETTTTPTTTTTTISTNQPETSTVSSPPLLIRDSSNDITTTSTETIASITEINPSISNTSSIPNISEEEHDHDNQNVVFPTTTESNANEDISSNTIDNNEANETTTDPYDYSKKIDIRSSFVDDDIPHAQSNEAISIESVSTTYSNSSNSNHSKTTSDDQNPLNIQKNLVRRRKAIVVIKRIHVKN